MQVAILTFGLTVLALGASGYPLPRISNEGNIAITSGDTLDQVPELARREIFRPGIGIGVSAGSVDPIPQGSIRGGQSPTAPVTPANPVAPNPQPVNPQPNPQPVSPQPVNPQPDTPAPVPIPVPIPVKPNVSAIQQIRQFDCQQWFYGGAEFNARPWYCSSGSPNAIGN